MAGAAVDAADAAPVAASDGNPYATEYFAEADKAAGVTSVHIPATVDTIDPAFFQLFPNASAITVDPANSTFTSFNGMLFNEQLTDLLLAPEGMEGVAVLPESLAAVPAYVISRCNKLSGLSFQPGSTGNNAFAAQDGVLYTADKTTLLAAPAGLGASISIAPECTAILEGAFWGNDHLKTIVATGEVTAISVGVASPEAPACILSVGAASAESEAADTPGAAFEQATIENATVITDDREAWETAGFTNFAKPAEPGDTIAPAPGDSGLTYTLMDNGQLSVKWTGDAPASGKRNIPSAATLHGVDYTVSVIEDDAFAGQTELTEIALPDTITAIGTSAFAGCTALGSVQLAGSVTSIGASAFEGCTSLTAVTLGGGLRTIGDSAFEATALTDIVLPASVQSIGNRAFAACEQLTAVVAQSSIAQVSETVLADTAGVNVYAPHEESGEYAWSIGPVASANHLLPYGVQLAQALYELVPADAVNVFENGGYLEAAGDAQASVSYKGNAVSADSAGAVHAKQPGTAAITYSINYKDLTLAKASCTAVVNTTPQPAEDSNDPAESTEDDEEADPAEEAPEASTEPTSEEAPAVDQDTTDEFDISHNVLNETVNITGASEEEADFSDESDFVGEEQNGDAATLGSGIARMMSASVYAAAGSERAVEHKKYTITVDPNGGQLYYVYFGNYDSESGSSFDSDNALWFSNDGKTYQKQYYYAVDKTINWSFMSGFDQFLGQGEHDENTKFIKGSFHCLKSISQAYQDYANAKRLRVWYENNVFPGMLIKSYRDTNGALIDEYGDPVPSLSKVDGTYKYACNLRAIRTGYSFQGWKSANLKTTIKSGRTDSIVNGDTLTAQWEACKFNITFNANEGSGGPAKRTGVAYDSALTRFYSADIPKRTGYTFDGYYTKDKDGNLDKKYFNDDGTVYLSPNKFQVTSDLTLYAKWNPKTYDLILKETTGPKSTTTSTLSNKLTYDAALPSVTKPTPSDRNYTFQGYYTQSDGKGTKYYDANGNVATGTGALSENKYETDGSTTLYAYWKGVTRTLYFDKNGGTGGNPNPVTVEWGAALPTIDSQKPTRSGYTFLGWYTKGDGDPASTEGDRYYDQNNNACHDKWDYFESGLTYSTYLYAHWGYNIDVLQPKGVFPYNEGSNKHLVDLNGTFVNGFTQTDNNDTGYKFEGIFSIYGGSREDNSFRKVMNRGSNRIENPASGETLSNSSVFHAIYTSSVLVQPNGGLPSATFYTTCAVGYFARSTCYWIGPQQYNGYPGTIWHSGIPAAGGGYTGDDAVWNHTKTYYKLVGYSNSSGNTSSSNCLVMPGGPKRFYTPCDDWPTTTLYANWAYARYQVSYNSNGGSGSMTSHHEYMGTNPTIKKCTFTPPTGMHFAGWRKGNATTGDWIPGSTTSDTTYNGDLSTTNGGYVTLYAQWANNTYTIKYNANGGTGTMENSSATCNTTNVISRCTFENKGYTFIGWNTEADGSGEPVEGSTSKNTSHTGNLTTTDGGSVTLFAQWRANVYSIELTNRDADMSRGTSTVYLRYNDGYYTDRICSEDNKITKIVTPQRYGYDFTGYPGFADSAGNIIASKTAHTVNQRIDPSWDIYTCTITLVANHDGAAVKSQDISFDFTNYQTKKLTNPFGRDYFEFKNWDTEADGVNGSAYGNNVVIPTELAQKVATSEGHKLKLYAQWTQTHFNVTFYPHGGSYVEPQIVKVGEKVTEPTVKRDGYHLLGWYSTPMPSSESERFIFDRYTMPNRDLELHAVWENNQFTVNFDPGIGTAAGKVDPRTYTYEAVNADGTPQAQHLPNFDSDLGFSCKGGTFKGWVKAEDVVSPNTPKSDAPMWSNTQDVRTGLVYEGSVTLVAIWDPVSYPIIYLANAPADSTPSGSTPIQSVPYVFSGTPQPHPTVTQCGTTCEGYEFMGWNTQADGKGISIAPNASTTDELTMMVDGQPVIVNGQEQKTTLQDLAIADGNNHIVLFAQWRGAPYQVHFEANPPEGETAEGTMEDQTLYWGLADNLKPNEFKVSGGWTFSGWNTMPDGSGTPYTDGALVRNLRPEEGQEIPTLYAQWDVVFSVDVPTVDHINVTMNSDGEWITVDSADVTVKSYSPRPVGIQGISCEGTDGLGQILQDTSQANQLVLNLNSQGTTVPLSAGTTSTDPNFYFKLEEGSAADPATLPLNVDLATRNADIKLIEHVEPITAFRLTFLLGVVEN